MVFSNSLLFGAAAAASAGSGFNSSLVPNSVHFDGSNELMERNTSSHSSTKCIMACWFQLCKIPLSSNQGLMYLGEASNSSGSNQNGLFFSYDSAQIEMDLYFYCNGNRASPRMSFRDVGWYHILASFDLGQSGIAKGKLFINGIEITDYQSDARGSWSTSFTNTTVQEVGGFAGGSSFPGYIAQAVMLDGQSIQDSDVAITDFVDAFTFGTNGSQFVPKADAAIAALATSAGDNSFCLDFTDSTGTNAANLGLDISNNDNDLTPENMAAGNQSTNTPSKNFSIFNPLANGDNTGLGSFSLSNGNQTATLSSSNTWLKTTIPFVMSGSNIIRTQFTIDTVGNSAVGITGSSHTAGTYHTSGLGRPGQGEVLLQNDGAVIIDGNFGSAGGYTSSWSNGDVIDVIVNLDVGGVWFARNGTLGGSATQAEIEAGTTTNAALVSSFVRRTAGEVFNFYVAQTNSSNPTFTYNSGQSSFSNSYSTITSLIPLSTADLTAPTFQGIDFFNTVGYTGNGSTNNITGTGFQPDLVAIKSKTSASPDDWGVYDAIRGTTKQLSFNLPTNSGDADEQTESTGLTAFGSDGFSIGALAEINTSSATFAAYQWLGQNGTTSISSGTGKLASTVSVSAAGNFSIVSWSGSGANTTVGHGLSVAPELVFYKNRSTTDNWVIYCDHLSSDDHFLLMDDVAESNSSGSTMFNSTAPTASVLSVGSNNATNKSGDNMIAYCFSSIAGVCKVGVYEGNSNADGPYVALGFTPATIIWKNIDSTTSWPLVDNTNNAPASGNPFVNWLLTDSNGTLGGSGSFDVDFLADAFKPRLSTSGYNSNTVIYLAMADIGGNGTLPPIYAK